MTFLRKGEAVRWPEEALLPTGMPPILLQQSGWQAEEVANYPGSSLTRADWVIMLAGFLLCLIISLVLGHKRIFWEDEMLGWMLLSDPSWTHMISAWKQGADGGGFTFYVTCRGWFKVFGASEVSFRMYSAVCFGLAFCVTWVTARKYYAARIAAPALLSAWFLSPPLVTHLVEGRFYGLLVLAVALVVWFSVSKCSQAVITTAALCAWAFVLNGLLVTSHVLGIIYSATVLLGLMLADRRTARWRPAVYASTIASWLLLLAELPAIRATTQVGKPWFWTLPPNLNRFFGAYCEFSSALAGLLFILLLLVFLSKRSSGAQWRTFLLQTSEGRWPLLISVFVLFLLPVALALQAQVGTSLFINRYLMPLTVAQALLLCQLFSMVKWSKLFYFVPSAFAERTFLIACASYALLLGAYVFVYLNHRTICVPDFTSELTARLPRGVPVLTEDAWMFTQVIGKQHASGVDYIYLLDWQQAVDKSSPKLEVTQYHLMENWKKVGYFSGSIVDRKPFLATHPHFLILHTPATPPPEGPMIGNPLVDRFKRTDGYVVQPYDRPGKSEIEIWQVCRKSCAE